MLLHRFLPLTFIRGSLHTSTVLHKQPAHDRQRRRRKIVPPFHQQPYYDEDPLKKIKLHHIFPSNIPGSWGSTDIATKEKFFKVGQTLGALPSLYDKLGELYYHENNMWYHRINLPLDCTETLEFSQYITRTTLRHLKEIEGIHSSASNVNTVLRNRLQELVALSSFDQTMAPKTRQLFLSSFMECIHGTLAEYFRNCHLCDSSNQLCTGAKVETFFKRTGFADIYDNERIGKERLLEDIWEPNQEIVLDSDGMLRFRVCSNLAWLIRSVSPLPPFVAPSEAVCFENTLPPDGRLYRPEVFDFEPTNHYEFSCLPFVDNARSPEYIRTVAGFWPDSPFWPVSGGDPCHFGLLGVLDVTPTNQLALLSPDDPITSKVIARNSLSQGLLAAFALSSAMAYNQGFTLYNEIDRPFTTQLLLYNAVDQSWQLLAYQLNSLCGLWKAEDAGEPLNLAWHSERIPMFEKPGDIHSRLNVEAVALISSAMMRAPEERADTQSPRRLIPDSVSEEELRAEVHAEGVLTAAEHDALLAAESDEVAKRNLPLRVFPKPTPHPNEVFFLKLTDRAELLEEMREKMPAFGGPRTPFYEDSEMPLKTREAIRELKRIKRAKTPHSKVLRRPTRWR
ncbi:unnamed protein product [Mesocestoides corti]|uniref:28S ribosomal protein S30, mitochondrial n=1 Tax=Mesocestoides corti TaxID=53468 RepID=A0A0R3UA59_MESCO|nr:unnamed protein product [Mesocestoides corti]